MASKSAVGAGEAAKPVFGRGILEKVTPRNPLIQEPNGPTKEVPAIPNSRRLSGGGNAGGGASTGGHPITEELAKPGTGSYHHRFKTDQSVESKHKKIMDELPGAFKKKTGPAQEYMIAASKCDRMQPWVAGAQRMTAKEFRVNTATSEINAALEESSRADSLVYGDARLKTSSPKGARTRSRTSSSPLGAAGAGGGGGGGGDSPSSRRSGSSSVKSTRGMGVSSSAPFLSTSLHSLSGSQASPKADIIEGIGGAAASPSGRTFTFANTNPRDCEDDLSAVTQSSSSVRVRTGTGSRRNISSAASTNSSIGSQRGHSSSGFRYNPPPNCGTKFLVESVSNLDAYEIADELSITDHFSVAPALRARHIASRSQRLRGFEEKYEKLKRDVVADRIKTQKLKQWRPRNYVDPNTRAINDYKNEILEFEIRHPVEALLRGMDKTQLQDLACTTAGQKEKYMSAIQKPVFDLTDREKIRSIEKTMRQSAAMIATGGASKFLTRKQISDMNRPPPTPVPVSRNATPNVVGQPADALTERSGTESGDVTPGGRKCPVTGAGPDGRVSGRSSNNVSRVNSGTSPGDISRLSSVLSPTVSRMNTEQPFTIEAAGGSKGGEPGAAQSHDLDDSMMLIQSSKSGIDFGVEFPMGGSSSQMTLDSIASVGSDVEEGSDFEYGSTFNSTFGGGGSLSSTKSGLTKSEVLKLCVNSMFEASPFPTVILTNVKLKTIVKSKLTPEVNPYLNEASRPPTRSGETLNTNALYDVHVYGSNRGVAVVMICWPMLHSHPQVEMYCNPTSHEEFGWFAPTSAAVLNGTKEVGKLILTKARITEYCVPKPPPRIFPPAQHPLLISSQAAAKEVEDAGGTVEGKGKAKAARDRNKRDKVPRAGSAGSKAASASNSTSASVAGSRRGSGAEGVKNASKSQYSLDSIEEDNGEGSSCTKMDGSGSTSGEKGTEDVTGFRSAIASAIHSAMASVNNSKVPSRAGSRMGSRRGSFEMGRDADTVAAAIKAAAAAAAASGNTVEDVEGGDAAAAAGRAGNHVKFISPGSSRQGSPRLADETRSEYDGVDADGKTVSVTVNLPAEDTEDAVDSYEYKDRETKLDWVAWLEDVKHRVIIEKRPKFSSLRASIADRSMNVIKQGHVGVSEAVEVAAKFAEAFAASTRVPFAAAGSASASTPLSPIARSTERPTKSETRFRPDLSIDVANPNADLDSNSMFSGMSAFESTFGGSGSGSVSPQSVSVLQAKALLSAAGMEKDEYTVILSRPKVPTNIRGYRWNLTGNGGGIMSQKSRLGAKANSTAGSSRASPRSRASSRGGESDHSDHEAPPTGRSSSSTATAKSVRAAPAHVPAEVPPNLYEHNLKIARTVEPSKHQIALYFRDTGGSLQGPGSGHKVPQHHVIKPPRVLSKTVTGASSASTGASATGRASSTAASAGARK